MVLDAGVGSGGVSPRLSEASSLVEALGRADRFCKGCEAAASPMVCMERCDVWRVKHEISEIKKITGDSTHTRKLLNVLKNKRRLKVLEAVCERSRSVQELQRSLRESCFYHSRQTILEAYVKPLTRVGLVAEEGVRFRATFYGRKVQGLLSGKGFLDFLPVHSCCYEEIVMRELLSAPRTFDELATHVPKKSLSRILMRLRAKGLLVEKARSPYVFYHRARGKPKARFSSTERRVFEAIPQVGISVRSLSGVVGINVRRTFKYLHRLREKKLVFALKTRRTYELTGKGREIVGTLGQIERIAESSLNLTVPIAPRLP